MPNIAALLKSEISRVARKEVRAEIESLRKQVSAQRTALAALKRELGELRKESKRTAAPKRALQMEMEAPQPDEVKRRFSASRLAAHRQKTGLSAADYGALVGVSGQSIYHYEQGKARPHAAVVRKLSMIKELGKTQLLALLDEQKATSSE